MILISYVGLFLIVGLGGGTLPPGSLEPAYAVRQWFDVRPGEAAATANDVTLVNGADVGDRLGPDYHTVEGMEAFLTTMQQTYPALVEKLDIGDSYCKRQVNRGCTVSWPSCPGAPSCLPGLSGQAGTTTWKGYDLSVLHISGKKNPPGILRPVFWFDAGTHANEVDTCEIAIRFIAYLLTQYGKNPDVTWLVDYNDIYIMPMVNPDGHHMMEVSPYGQRKNLNPATPTPSPTASPSPTPCSIYPGFLGVDLNRNYPYQWAQIYCVSGAGPASEPETQAVTNFLSGIYATATNRGALFAMGIAQSMHGYLRHNLMPWNYIRTAPPFAAELQNLAQRMKSSDLQGNLYPACQTTSADPTCGFDWINPNLSYHGTTIDWIYGTLGIPAFSTEIDGVPLDVNWNANLSMLIGMLKVARAPMYFSHGPETITTVNAQGYDPATMTLSVKKGSQAEIRATVTYEWSGNAFHQKVEAVECFIDVLPWDNNFPYPSAQGIAMPFVGQSDSGEAVGVNVKLNTSALSLGRHTVFIHGKGGPLYPPPNRIAPTWGPMSAVFLNILPP